MVGMIFFQKWYYMHPPSFQRSNFFNRHPSYPNHWMPTNRGEGLCYDFGKKINFMLHFPFQVIKEFRLPSNGVGALDGNWNSSIATKGSWPKEISVVHPYCNYKFSVNIGGDQNGTRCGNQKISRTILSSLFFRWWLNFFNRHKKGL